MYYVFQFQDFAVSLSEFSSFENGKSDESNCLYQILLYLTLKKTLHFRFETKYFIIDMFVHRYIPQFKEFRIFFH